MARQDDFDYAAWMAEPGLALCKISTQGFWFNALANMKLLGGVGSLSKTEDEWAKLCRCTLEEVRIAVSELSEFNVCPVSKCANAQSVTPSVTLVSRRMSREYANREKATNRQRKRRLSKTGDACHAPCHADVTPPVTLLSQITPPSPLPSPSSLSPVPPLLSPSPIPPPPFTDIRGREEKTPEAVTKGLRHAAVAAFDRWSGVIRGHGVKETENEHTQIFQLLEALSTDAPIHVGNADIPAHRMVPDVVDWLIRGRMPWGKGNGHIRYAVKCVRTELDEWRKAGVPGTRASERDKPAPGPTYNVPRCPDKELQADYPEIWARLVKDGFRKPRRSA